MLGLLSYAALLVPALQPVDWAMTFTLLGVVSLLYQLPSRHMELSEAFFLVVGTVGCFSSLVAQTQLI